MTICFLAFFLTLFSSSISPVELGILDTESEEERYNILYQAHWIALEKGIEVDYRGIDTLRISIPRRAKSIPLGPTTDFNAVVFIVNNETMNNFFLFSSSNPASLVSIKDKSSFDSGNFRSTKVLRSGFKMLVVEDKNPWVENRRGYNYGAIRKDIILLKDGKAQNTTVAPYNNPYSKPVCSMVTPSEHGKSFSNIEFYRTEKSTFKTFLVKFENDYGIHLANITVNTPEGTGLYGDTAIFLTDCADVLMENIIINNTYSESGKYGYGISMDNVLDVVFDQVKGDAPWGVFGNNNINNITLRNSDVNRFDVHCYGKDLSFEDCLFDTAGLLYSSVYGLVRFTRCTFDHVFPCLNRLDYNAYSPFTLVFRGCNFSFDRQHYAVVNLSDIDEIPNPRFELSRKCLPDISLIDCNFTLAPDMKFLYIFYVGKCRYPWPVGNISSIEIENLQVSGSGTPLSLSNTYISTASPVKTKLGNITYRHLEEPSRPYHSFVNLKMLNHKAPDKNIVVGREFVK